MSSGASAGLTGTGPTGVPTSAYIAKYNRFVDTIMERVNKILRRSYDPVNVRLQPPQPSKAANSATKKKKKTRPHRQQAKAAAADAAAGHNLDAEAWVSI